MEKAGCSTSKSDASLNTDMHDSSITVGVGASSHLDNVMHQAVFNALIMSKIFGCLPTKDLMECRLVCTDWENVGTPLLGKRTFLSLMKFNNGPVQGAKKLKEQVQQQLRRRVKCLVKEPPTEKIKRKLVDKRAFYFIKNNKDHVMEIKFKLHLSSYETLKMILDAISFTKLKKICINETFQMISQDEYFKRLSVKASLFPEMPTVQILEFFVSEYIDWTFELNSDEVPIPCHPIYQCIINSCSNLEQLMIRGNYYPDLSKCSKLNQFDYKAIPFDVVDRDDDDDSDSYCCCDCYHSRLNRPSKILDYRGEFSTLKLLTMLKQVNKSLKILKLGTCLLYSGEYEHGIPHIEVVDTDRVPRFPRLTKLHVENVPVFKTIIAATNPQRFPALEALRLVNHFRYDRNWDDFLKDGVDRFQNVKDAYLNPFMLSSYPAQNQHQYDIVRRFPSVTDMSVTITAIYGAVGAVEMFLEHLTTLRHLRNLTLRIKFNCNISKLLRCFCVNDFEDLQTLKLVALKKCTIVDDEKAQAQCYFEKPFLAFKNITFDGFLLKWSTTNRMLTFARQNHLKVNFMN